MKKILAFLLVAVLVLPGVAVTGIATAIALSLAGCAPGPGPGALSPDAPVPEQARRWVHLAATTCSDLPEAWFAAVMAQESSFDPNAYADDVNGGTWGLFQINNGVWTATYGAPWSADRNGNGIWDVREPLIHAEVGARYLCSLLAQVRRLREANPEWPAATQLTELEALALAHNAGPGALRWWPDVSAEVRSYVTTVTDRALEWTARPASSTADPRADIPETARVVMPLAEGSYDDSSPYGLRIDPFTGERRFHYGTDMGAAEGTPIVAIADGLVIHAGYLAGWNNIIVIEHTVAGERVASAYLHMWDWGIHVRAGDRVRAGDHIADVGAEGRAKGAHLHLEIHPGGWPSSTVDPLTWLAAHGAVSHSGATSSTARCGW